MQLLSREAGYLRRMQGKSEGRAATTRRSEGSNVRELAGAAGLGRQPRFGGSKGAVADLGGSQGIVAVRGVVDGQRRGEKNVKCNDPLLIRKEEGAGGRGRWRGSNDGRATGSSPGAARQPWASSPRGRQRTAK